MVYHMTLISIIPAVVTPSVTISIYSVSTIVTSDITTIFYATLK